MICNIIKLVFQHVLKTGRSYFESKNQTNKTNIYCFSFLFRKNHTQKRYNPITPIIRSSFFQSQRKSLFLSNRNIFYYYSTYQALNSPPHFLKKKMKISSKSHAFKKFKFDAFFTRAITKTIPLILACIFLHLCKVFYLYLHFENIFQPLL